MALFVDFKKAFDLINPELLFLKLFHYGFDNKSLMLIKDYFKNRKQVTIVEDSLSPPVEMHLGVPQGSVLGPLLFLIFINDLALNVDLTCYLFADDTTIYYTGNDLESVKSIFKLKLESFLTWVNFNHLFINWSKTKIMILADNKFYKLETESIVLDSKDVEVVSNFCLLGILIDQNLNFKGYVSKLKKSINIKLFSIKKLQYLSQAVKIHFFKTFILPHFDYCVSLLIFFGKKLISSLEKFFNICIFRLTGLNLFNLNIFEQKFFLLKYNILPYKMRIFSRISIFCFKVAKNLILRNFYNNLIFKNALYFRNREIVVVPDIRTKAGRSTFTYFLPKLINLILRNSTFLYASSSIIYLIIYKFFLQFLTIFNI